MRREKMFKLFAVLLAVMLLSSLVFMPFKVTRLSAEDEADSTAGNANSTEEAQHPTEPGEVMVFKEAKPVPGKVNTWQITLRVEAKDKPVNSDTLIIFDASGSMKRDIAGTSLATGDPNSRMEIAKEATKTLIDTLLKADPKTNPDNKNKVGLIVYSSVLHTPQDFRTNANIDELKTYVDGIKVMSGEVNTFTQLALHQARTTIKNATNENKAVILITDGGSNMGFPFDNDFSSLKTEVAKVFSYHYRSAKQQPTETQAPGSPPKPVKERDFASPRVTVSQGFERYVVSAGQNLNYDYNKSGKDDTRGGGVWSFMRILKGKDDQTIPATEDNVYLNICNFAIDEANLLKAEPEQPTLYTVGFALTDPTQQGLEPYIKAISGEDKYYPANNKENLEKGFSEIAGRIQSALQNAVVEDPMGQGFVVNGNKIISNKPNNPVTVEAKHIQWQVNNLAKLNEHPDFPNVADDIKYAELVYEIEIDDEILEIEQTDELTQTYQTNGDTAITYTDVDGNTVEKKFPKPKVNPVFYQLTKTVLNSIGQDITDSYKGVFEFRVTGKDYDHTYTIDLSQGRKTKVLTNLRWKESYTVEEISASPHPLEDWKTEFQQIRQGEVISKQKDKIVFRVPNLDEPDDENQIRDILIKTINSYNGPGETTVPTESQTNPTTAPTWTGPSYSWTQPTELPPVNVENPLPKAVPATGEQSYLPYAISLAFIGMLLALIKHKKS